MKTRSKLLVVIGVLVALAAILGSITIATRPAQSMGSHQTVESTVQVRLPVDVTGTWKTKSGSKPSMTATITADMIDVELASADTTLTFWHGTFETVLTKSVTSTGLGIGDPGGKPYWSTEKTKNFTLEGDKLTFEFTSSGASTKVVMSRG